MTITELQKRLQEMYEKYGDIEVAIQNGDDGGDYCGQRSYNKLCSRISSRRRRRYKYCFSEPKVLRLSEDDIG